MDGDDIPGWGGSAQYSSILPEAEGDFSVNHILEKLLNYHRLQIELEHPQETDTSMTQYKETLESFYLDKQVHLFDFLLQLTDKEEPLKQTLQLLRRISTDSLPKYNTIEELLLSTDLTGAKVWLEEELTFPEGLSKAQLFKEQIAKYLKLHPLVVNDILQCTEDLKQKVTKITKVGDQIKQFEYLPTNDSLIDVLLSFQKYLGKICEDFDLKGGYNKLIAAYQKLYVLQDIIKSIRATQNEHLVPLCMVCFTDPVESVVTPCGHTFCRECVKKTNTARSCFCCRTKIQGSQRIYFS